MDPLKQKYPHQNSKRLAPKISAAFGTTRALASLLNSRLFPLPHWPAMRGTAVVMPAVPRFHLASYWVVFPTWVEKIWFLPSQGRLCSGSWLSVVAFWVGHGLMLSARKAAHEAGANDLRSGAQLPAGQANRIRSGMKKPARSCRSAPAFLRDTP